MRSQLFLLPLFGWLLCIAPLHSAEKWPVSRGPSREPFPFKFEPKVLKQVPKSFIEDAVATIIHAGSSYLVAPDGTIETTIHEVSRLNGRKGIERLGEFRGIIYTPSYQTLTLNVARIHKRTGKMVDVEPRHVHLRDVGTDYQVYDPEKQLIISFPGLEVGDTLEVKWTLRGKNPEHDNQFFTRYAFGDPKYPVYNDEVVVRIPADRTLKHATVNGSTKPTITQTKEGKTYRWKAGNLERSPRYENLPSREELRETVIVSTFTDWKQVGAWKARLRKDCWSCTPQMKDLVTTITKDLKTPLEKARALTYWVRRNIRYVSVGDKHDYTPHHPDTVVANRFGDCKDTSQLLAVLLREAGLKVELVTLGVQDDGQIHPEVPSPWGTHAILLVTIDGNKHWIDTTTSLAGWDFLPRDDLDRVCYLTDEKGNLRLDRTPPMSADRFRTEQTTDVWIGTDGSSRCRREVISYGHAALIQRDSFLEVPPGERRRQVGFDLQDANSRTRLLNLQVDEKALRNFDLPVKVVMDFEIPRHFSGTSELDGSFTDSKVWGKLLAYTIDHDRNIAMVFPAPFESIHTYRFHLPPAYSLDSFPAERNIVSAWGSFKATVKTIDDSDATRFIEVRFQTRLEKARIEPANLEEFRKFQEKVGREYRMYLTLRAVRTLSSTSKLEQAAFLAPQNPITALTLARIYLRAERPGDARRVLDRALAYNPGHEQLQRLRVDTAESPADEEKAQRELVKRFPKDLDHLRDLGAILVGQGKQEQARDLLKPLTKQGSPSQRALARYQLARSYYRKNELPQAAENLDEALKESEEAVNTLRFHTLRGQVLEELKRPADALKAYRKALNLDKRNQEILLSLIRLEMGLGHEFATLDLLRRYVLVVDNDPTGLRLAAETYYLLKRYDEALELALRSRELGFHEKTQRILGLIYFRRAEWDKAYRHLDKAEPDAQVLLGLIQTTLELGRLRDLDRLVDRCERLNLPNQALKQEIARAKVILTRRSELIKSVKVAPEKEDLALKAIDAVVCAEDALRRGGTPQRVEELVKKATDPNINFAGLHTLKGRIALNQGKLSLAKLESEKAIKLGPNEPGGYFLRGKVELERAQSGAVETLRKAVALSHRKDVEMLVALATALVQQRKVQEAIATLKEALNLHPTNAELKDQLRTMELSLKKKAG